MINSKNLWFPGWLRIARPLPQRTSLGLGVVTKVDDDDVIMTSCCSSNTSVKGRITLCCGDSVLLRFRFDPFRTLSSMTRIKAWRLPLSVELACHDGKVCCVLFERTNHDQKLSAKRLTCHDLIRREDEQWLRPVVRLSRKENQNRSLTEPTRQLEVEKILTRDIFSSRDAHGVRHHPHVAATWYNIISVIVLNKPTDLKVQSRRKES
jgi:hypothetical protein